MRASKYLLATLKEIPKNCEIISHQLMLRAGLIRQISSGLYIWLPTGLRVLEKIKNVIREEMNKNGVIEISMPIVQPAQLWKQSGRWLDYGPELLRFKNRNDQEFILSPTHEEMISEFVCKEMISYKQFPLNLYQIHTKYRDEIRPQFGTIRAREFIMKDGYSFHINQQSLHNTYHNMYDVYRTIFHRIGVNFRVVQADPGNIGGILSHEFQAYCKNSKRIIKHPVIFNENFKKKPDTICNLISITQRISPPQEIKRLINAPEVKSVEELIIKFNLSIFKILKTIIVRINNKNDIQHDFLGLIIRADHCLNYKKIATVLKIPTPISLANEEDIYRITGTKSNLLGAINITIPLVIDHNAAIINDFVAGSNISGQYFFGMNWGRDLPLPMVVDLHNSIHLNTHYVHKDNKLHICDFVEIGHIFQLGNKYSTTIHTCIQKNSKHNLTITMGCYGIGITRIIPVLIEQNYDENGIIWRNDIIAPFILAIIPINMHKSIRVKKITEKIYNQLLSIVGTDVFVDDRQESVGKMFADIELIGVPHILIISDNNLKKQEVEYKYRKTGAIKNIKLDELIQFLITALEQ